MVSRLILSVAESIDPSPSTLLGSFNLHHGNRLDDSIAAAGGTFACFLNALVVLGKRPNLFEGFVTLLASKFVSWHFYTQKGQKLCHGHAPAMRRLSGCLTLQVDVVWQNR